MNCLKIKLIFTNIPHSIICLLRIVSYFSESCTSVHEESVTCPLEVSELEPLEIELSDVDNKIPVSSFVIKI